MSSHGQTSLRGAEELVKRVVADARLLALVRGIATRRRRRPTLGVDTTDEGCVRRHARPFVALGLEQQPRNGAARRRVGAASDFADHAAIGKLPGRSRKVSTDLTALL